MQPAFEAIEQDQNTALAGRFVSSVFGMPARPRQWRHQRLGRAARQCRGQIPLQTVKETVH